MSLSRSEGPLDSGQVRMAFFRLLRASLIEFVGFSEAGGGDGSLRDINGY